MRVAFGLILLSGIALIMPSAFLPLFAQDRCGTVEYSKMLDANPAERKINFERWMTGLRLKRMTQQARRQAEPYRIPVVVHVIHNGENIGEGANIPEAQILSQLQVLNEDFNRLNADAAQTPPQFSGVAASLNVEFVLAKQDPNGLPTNGIVRVDGGRAGWAMADNYSLKGLSYWPAEQYMNIWVCNLVDNYLGYAQHPESDLPGMENSSTNRLTDGIVIWHRAFGSVEHGAFNLDPTFSKGRTATHEIAHFLGLNHIWGDDAGCNGTDYVDDTPNQGGPTRGCPMHPRTDNCGETIMFQNFLDYTDDACMNLFTQGQVDRMAIVLENSPRRKTLLSSPGLLPPDPFPNDIGIHAIVQPDVNICSHDVSPVIAVRNYGENDITSARIRFVLNGVVQETVDFDLTLAPQESTELTFSPITLPAGEHNLDFQVLLTNGTTDQGSHNDHRTSTVVVPAFGSLPLALNFEEPHNWVIHNPDGQVTWEIVPVGGQNPSNRALKLNLYNYEDKLGEIDALLSPILNLSAEEAATLTFDVAYARYQRSNDRLRVIVLTDCQDLLDGAIVYDKAGGTLETASSQTSAFTPGNTAHWRREVIDLTPFLGTERVQIAFVGINDWGNNIYLDNIALVTEVSVDAALVRLNAPSPVTCTDQVAPRLLVQNNGTVPLDALTALYSVNGGAVREYNAVDLGVSVGASTEIVLPEIALEEGENTIYVSLTNVNETGDFNPGDNEKTFTVAVNHARERIPLRETFEGPFADSWTTVAPTGGTNWETAQFDHGTSLFYYAYANPAIGEEAWLVSPVLDFSRASDASVVFDFSHRRRSGQREELSVYISRDCGLTYEELDFTPPRQDSFDGDWIPDSEDDWVRDVVVKLTTLAGEENARVAFVVRNENGNNLYLDNVEFFVTSFPDLIAISEIFSVYGYNPENMPASQLSITFNLDRRQDVRFSVINTAGQMETDGILVDVLNQTFPLNLSARLVPGVYFIRVQIDGKFHTRKVMVY